MLDKFQRHMSEIQANVHVLTREKDQANQLYEQVILNSSSGSSRCCGVIYFFALLRKKFTAVFLGCNSHVTPMRF